MRTLLPLLLAAALVAADPPPVPDPIGLGERLALIDHLQERYRIRLPGEPTLDELRAAYRRAWEAAQPAPIAADPGVEQAASRERSARLRALILRRHAREADVGLDEDALQAELRRLDAAKAERDAKVIAAMVAADAAAPRPIPVPATVRPAWIPAAEPAAAVPAEPALAAAGGPQIRAVPFPVSGVTGCALVEDGGVSALLVMFGTDHNGAFRGLPGAMLAALRGAPGLRRAVLLMGHGTGNSIGGEPIEAHLKANRAFYETLGNTAQAQPVECLVFASCAAGNPNQMAAMRDGLGYYPTWRVATGNRTYANALVVLAALHAVAQRPAAPAWRGLFRFAPAGGEVTCFGEVGAGGERADTDYFRIVEEGGRWRVEEQK